LGVTVAGDGRATPYGMEFADGTGRVFAIINGNGEAGDGVGQNIGLDPTETAPSLLALL